MCATLVGAFSETFVGLNTVVKTFTYNYHLYAVKIKKMLVKVIFARMATFGVLTDLPLADI